MTSLTIAYEAPGSRPFAAPSTTATYTVPANITNNGSADASSALQTWINGVPDGSVIDFAIPGANYRLDAGIELSNRSNLIFRGHANTTLTLHTTANSYWQSAFVVRNGTNHVTIDGFTVTGENNDWALSNENVAVLAAPGWYGDTPTSYIEMTNVVASHIYGDGVYVEGRNSDGTPSSYYWVHDCSFDWIGRNVISLINVHHVWFEDNTTGDVGGAMLDIEPNSAANGESIDSVWYRNNTLGVPSKESAGGYGWFVTDAQIGTGIGCIVSNISVTNNTIIGNPANGVDGQPRALHSRFGGASTGHHSNITFTGNSTAMTVAGGDVLYFNYVDGVVCTGNTQPLSGGALVLATNCTNTVLSPNP